jgi:hypothetical protein
LIETSLQLINPNKKVRSKSADFYFIRLKSQTMACRAAEVLQDGLPDQAAADPEVWRDAVPVHPVLYGVPGYVFLLLLAVPVSYLQPFS